MKILCLYNNEIAEELFKWLSLQGHETILMGGRLNAEWCRLEEIDLAVSYTYRHILTTEILNALNNNVVNLHTSYLPWNRGADPNIWSILEDTPRGVTLHYMDSRLDKGYIIEQRLVGRCSSQSTLKETYLQLDKEAKELFKRAFAYYDYWTDMRKLPVGEGSYHSSSDGKRIKRIIGTYDISISELKEVYSVMEA